MLTTEALVAEVPKDEPPMGGGGHDHGGGMGGMGF
jgi:chaperonin GroEL